MTKAMPIAASKSSPEPKGKSSGTIALAVLSIVGGLLLVRSCLLNDDRGNNDPAPRASRVSSPTNEQRAPTAPVEDLSQYEEVVRSSPDSCRYFLVQSTPIGNTMRVVSAQDCPTWGITFTEREYDCEKHRTRYLGDHGSSPETIQAISPPDSWARLLPGSSAADTAALVCGRLATNGSPGTGLRVSRKDIQARLDQLELGLTYEETEPLMDGRERMFAELDDPMVLVEMIGSPDNLESVTVATFPSDDPDSNTLSGIIIAVVLAEVTSEAGTEALLDWYTEAVRSEADTQSRVYGGMRFTVTKYLETLGNISLYIEPA